MEIGDRIREARIRRGLKQSELAEAVGVSDTAVVLWENKKNRRAPAGDNLRRVAEVLDVPIHELLGERDAAVRIVQPRSSTMALSVAEKALLDLFRGFPEELKLLQLANFVECAKLGHVRKLARQEKTEVRPDPATVD